MRYILASIFFLISLGSLLAQTAHDYNVKGDKAYDKANYSGAEENYLKAYNDKNTYQSKYNLGNSLYKQDRYEEAIEAYDQATGLASSEGERADSYYNLGTAQLKNLENDPESIDDAVANLKKAIKYDPTNEDAKTNLFHAQVLKRIKQKQEEQNPQQQEQSDQQNQENQENQEQEQNQEEQENQDQESSDEEQEQKEKEQKEHEQQNPADSSSQSGKIDTISLEDLSKEEAERLLRIVEQEEKKIQDRLKRQQSNRNKPEKDW